MVLFKVKDWESKLILPFDLTGIIIDMKNAELIADHNSNPHFSSISYYLFPLMFWWMCLVFQAREIIASEWNSRASVRRSARKWYIDSTITSIKDSPPWLLAGAGKEYANGHWYSVTNVEPGAYFHPRAFSLRCGGVQPENPGKNNLESQSGAPQYKNIPQTL